MTTSFDFIGQIKTIEPLTVSLSTEEGLPINGHGLAYFPGSSIRGAIRHAGHKFLCELEKERNKGKSFPIETHFMLAQGFIMSKEVEKQIQSVSTSTAVDEHKEIRAMNPFISLFGRWGIAGHFGCGIAQTTSKSDARMFDLGVRKSMFDNNESMTNEITSCELERYNKMMSQNANASIDKKQMMKEIASLKRQAMTGPESEKKGLFDKVKQIEKTIKNLKAEKTESETSLLMPLQPVHAIDAGVELEHRMSVKSATSTELGLLLFSLANFAKHPYLGGHFNQNFGLVHAQWEVKAWLSPKSFKKETIGIVTIDDQGFSFEDITKEKVLTKAIADFNVNVKSMDFNRYI
jgi:CRISPR/Cas system CSM-associated protein Csm3 (group 7 of RAMP superfamily)